MVFAVIRDGKVSWRGRVQDDLIAMCVNQGVKNNMVFYAAGMTISWFKSRFMLSFYHLKHASRAFAGLLWRLSCTIGYHDIRENHGSWGIFV